VSEPETCLFCAVARGTIPADRVASDDHCLAFRDINPQAPVHVLVIPRAHVQSLEEASDTQLLGRLLLMAAQVARLEGIAESGYRTVLNTNGDGGQSVPHLHAHVLGGRSLAWPPG
jgi:histidine triad (HIT) family protein